MLFHALKAGGHKQIDFFFLEAVIVFFTPGWVSCACRQVFLDFVFIKAPACGDSFLRGSWCV